MSSITREREITIVENQVEEKMSTSLYTKYVYFYWLSIGNFTESSSFGTAFFLSTLS